LRPEDYANLHLHKFLSISSTSEKAIHDARVELRRYLVVAKATYLLHSRAEAILVARSILRKLGEVRDMDVLTCLERDKRDYLARKVISQFGKMAKYELPRMYGSRLLVARRVKANASALEVEEDFHKVRKRIRESRFLLESLGQYSYTLREISRTLGDMRDVYLYSVKCLKVERKVDWEKVDELRRKALEEIKRKLYLAGFT